MKRYWKLLIAIAGLGMVLALTLNFVVKYIVDKEIQKIREQLAGHYDFEYEDLDVDVIKKVILLENFKFNTLIDSSFTKNKFDFSLDKLYIHLNSYARVATTGMLDIKKIVITAPSVKYGLRKYETKTPVKKDTVKTAIKEPFLKHMKLAEFILTDGKGDVYRLGTKGKTILSLQRLNIDITGVELDFATDSLFAKSSVKTYSIDVSNIYNNEIKDKELSIKNMHYDNQSGGLTITGFHIANTETPKVFSKKLKYRNAWMSIDVDTMYLEANPWHVYRDGAFYLGKLMITRPVATIYTDLNIPLSPKKKPMPSKMIRSIPVPVKLDTIEIVDGAFYFKPRKKGKDPGVLKFKPIHAYLTNITNIPEKLAEDPFMKLVMRSLIWDEGKVNIQIKVNVPDKNDLMHVEGDVKGLHAKKIENLVMNMFGVGFTSGYIDYLAFNYTANDTISRGRVVFDYHDLTIDMKKTDNKAKSKGGKSFSQKSNKFVNFMAKEAVIPNNQPGTQNYAASGVIYYERHFQKAFFDLIWGSIQSGIMDVAVKDAFYKSERNYKKKKKKIDKENATSERNKILGVPIGKKKNQTGNAGKNSSNIKSGKKDTKNKKSGKKGKKGGKKKK